MGGLAALFGSFALPAGADETGFARAGLDIGLVPLLIYAPTAASYASRWSRSRAQGDPTSWSAQGTVRARGDSPLSKAWSSTRRANPCPNAPLRLTRATSEMP